MSAAVWVHSLLSPCAHLRLFSGTAPGPVVLSAVWGTQSRPPKYLWKICPEHCVETGLKKVWNKYPKGSLRWRRNTSKWYHNAELTGVFSFFGECKRSQFFYMLSSCIKIDFQVYLTWITSCSVCIGLQIAEIIFELPSDVLSGVGQRGRHGIYREIFVCFSEGKTGPEST